MSQPRTKTVDCQVQSVPALSEGLMDLVPLPLRSRVKLALKRALDAPTKRKLKRLTNRLRNEVVELRSLPGRMPRRLSCSPVTL